MWQKTTMRQKITARQKFRMRHKRRSSRLRASVWRAGMLLLLVACRTMTPPEACGMPPSATEDEVEAAYLYNFAKFIHWPQASAHRSIALCVLDDDRLESALERIVAGEVVDGRPLQSRSLSTIRQATDCDILFLGPSADARVNESLALLKDSPVVTVSNAADFLRDGGMIRFAMVGGAVRFSVNLEAANQAHVRISSQLLKVALAVVGRPQGDTP